jgi:hypothetical protein
MNSNNKKFRLFFDFIRYISSYFYTGENDICNSVNIINVLNIEDIKAGKILFRDIEFSESLMDVRIFKDKIFRKAVICGFQMIGRGFNYRKTALPTK